MYTNDGINISPAISVNGTARVFSVAYNGSMWVAGGGAVWYSYDGKNWLSSSSGNTFVNNSDNWMLSIAWGNGVWVSYVKGYNRVLYSTDGINWTESTSGSALMHSQYNHTNKCIAYGNGLFACVSYQTAMYSFDGINWTSSASGLSALGSNACNAMCWNGSFFLAGGTIYNTSNIMLKSYDGINWANLTINVDSANGWGITDIAWNGKFFVLQNGGLGTWRSYNGATWTQGTGDTQTDVSQLTWNGTYFTGVGNVNGYSKLTYSSDGITWAAAAGGASYPFSNMYGIASQNVLPFTPQNLRYIGPAGPTGMTGPSVNPATISYTPATPSNWASSAPTTLSAAIDRLAAAVYTLRGSAIP
jgi:hypothetical protein